MVEGRLPPNAAPPASVLPSSFTRPLRRPGTGPFTPPDHMAPRGAVPSWTSWESTVSAAADSCSAWRRSDVADGYESAALPMRMSTPSLGTVTVTAVHLEGRAPQSGLSLSRAWRRSARYRVGDQALRPSIGGDRATGGTVMGRGGLLARMVWGGGLVVSEAGMLARETCTRSSSSLDRSRSPTEVVPVRRPRTRSRHSRSQSVLGKGTSRPMSISRATASWSPFMTSASTGSRIAPVRSPNSVSPRWKPPTPVTRSPPMVGVGFRSAVAGFAFLGSKRSWRAGPTPGSTSTPSRMHAWGPSPRS